MSHLVVVEDIVHYVAAWGIAQICLCKRKYQSLQSCKACTQRKTGRTPTWAKMGTTSKDCSRSEWGNMAEKYRRNGQFGPIFHIFGIFRPFCPRFRSEAFPRSFPLFPIFGVRPLSHCVPLRIIENLLEVLHLLGDC